MYEKQVSKKNNNIVGVGGPPVFSLKSLVFLFFFVCVSLAPSSVDGLDAVVNAQS